MLRAARRKKLERLVAACRQSRVPDDTDRRAAHRPVFVLYRKNLRNPIRTLQA